MKNKEPESSIEDGALDFIDAFDPSAKWEDHRLTTWDRTSILAAIGQFPINKPIKL